MSYCTFFITSVAPNRIDDYKKLAETMAESWIKYGALEVQEFIGIDTPVGEVTSYPRAVKAEEGDIIITGFVRYASQEDKQNIMAQIMADPQMQEMFKNAPMNGMNMVFGGFEPLINRA